MHCDTHDHFELEVIGKVLRYQNEALQTPLWLYVD